MAGERREGGLSSLSDGVVAVEVPSLPSDTPLMVHLSEEGSSLSQRDSGTDVAAMMYPYLC